MKKLFELLQEKIETTLNVITTIEESGILIHMESILSPEEYFNISIENTCVDSYNETFEDILTFRHLYNSTLPENKYTISLKKFKEEDEIDFLVEDVFSFISSYLTKQQAEQDYAIDNNMSKRISILKQISREKNLAILKLQEELNEYNSSIKDMLFEETKRKGFNKHDVVMIKDNTSYNTLTKGKKYYIDNMSARFNTNTNNDNIKSFKPFVTFEVGRINSDGSFNFRTIGTDNHSDCNIDDSFLVVKNTMKTKFADNDSDINTNNTTYFISEEKEFPLIDNGKIIKHKELTYGCSFISNVLSLIRTRLYEENYDTNLIKDMFFYFESKGKKFLYFGLDIDKNFIINKKNMLKLSEMVETNSKYLIEVQSDFDIKDISINKEILFDKLKAQLKKRK